MVEAQCGYCPVIRSVWVIYCCETNFPRFRTLRQQTFIILQSLWIKGQHSLVGSFGLGPLIRGQSSIIQSNSHPKAQLYWDFQSHSQAVGRIQFFVLLG